MNAGRVGRIAHWAGVVLGAPVVLITFWAFWEWTRGGFPPTVTVDHVSLVLAMAAGVILAIYAMCRAVGWTLVKFAP
jgi:hypothetical protein